MPEAFQGLKNHKWLIVLGDTEIEYFWYSITQCCSIPSPWVTVFMSMLSVIIIYLQKNLHIYTLVQTSFLSKRPTWPNTSLIFHLDISKPKMPQTRFLKFISKPSFRMFFLMSLPSNSRWTSLKTQAILYFSSFLQSISKSSALSLKYHIFQNFPLPRFSAPLHSPYSYSLTSGDISLNLNLDWVTSGKFLKLFLNQVLHL